MSLSKGDSSTTTISASPVTPSPNLPVEMMHFLEENMDLLQHDFTSEFHQIIHMNLRQAQYKFLLFFVMISMIVWVIWWPYLDRLAQKVVTMKSMMNMIPLRVISENYELKAQYTARVLVKAVS